jgi:putative SOS response-associated peptidase YedK
VRSFAIITTTPNELCAEQHNQMPVILAPEAWPAWLGEEPADPQDRREKIQGTGRGTFVPIVESSAASMISAASSPTMKPSLKFC